MGTITQRERTEWRENPYCPYSVAYEVYESILPRTILLLNALEDCEARVKQTEAIISRYESAAAMKSFRPWSAQEETQFLEEMRRLHRESPRHLTTPDRVTLQALVKAEARAQQAEAERDVLALCVMGRTKREEGEECPADSHDCPYGFNKAIVDEDGIPFIPCGRQTIEDVKNCWIEKARLDVAQNQRENADD